MLFSEVRGGMEEKVLFSETWEYSQLFLSLEVWKEVEELPEYEDLSEYFFFIIIIVIVIIIFNLNTFKLSSWTSKYKFCNKFVVSFLQFPWFIVMQLIE